MGALLLRSLVLWLAHGKEGHRMQLGAPLLEQLGRDLRFGLRQMVKSRAFTLTAGLTLALGIGANSAVFSVLNAILLRPLPFPNAARLVRIYSVVKNESVGPSPLDSRDFSLQNHTFERVAVFDQWRKNVITAETGDNPENVNVGLGNLDLFEALGIRPVMGRLFTADESLPGRNHVALIAESFWQSHYARDPGILGRTIAINGVSYSIIGVLPQAIPGWLRGVNRDLEVWEPFVPVPGIWNDSERAERGFTSVGLLRQGVAIQQAQADLATVAASLATAYPIDHGVGVKVEPLVASRAGDLRPQLYLLMGAVTLIMLIACSNLAALLLARNTARQREFAMRAALGARRSTLVGQILVETLLLALLGGVCGVAFAAGIDLLVRHRHPQNLPLLAEVTLDWRVLLFTFLAAVCASILFGLAPAILSSKINLVDALKEGARGSSARLRHGFRKVLVISQIALSLMLTVSAALFLQTIMRLVNQEMGFRADHLLKAHFFLPGAQYPSPDAITRFCDEYAARLRALPGVRDVSITTIYPPFERWDEMFTVEGHPVSRAEGVPTTYFGVTDALYLKTAGIPLLKGRDFSDSDRENTPVVAIVNQTFANRFLRNEDPLEKKIDLGSPPNVPIQDPWLRDGVVPVTVIGVMADSKNDGLALPVEPQLITLFRQMPRVNFGFKDVLVRSATAPETIENAMQQQFHSIDPRLPLSEMMPMDEHIAEQTTDRRFTGEILAAFAVLGLVLAVVGIYGVVSYLVAQRNLEIGIRLALGAGRSHVLWLIVRQGLLLGAAGVCIGLVGTAAAARSLESVLYRISALDAVTLTSASVFLLLVALAASAIPARRATSIDPIKALRTE
jgi:putative ABC transport system permease protein